MRTKEKIKQVIVNRGQALSAPEIARIIHGGADKTTTTHIRAIRKAVGEMVDAGEIVAAGSDQKRGQLYGLAVANDEDDDGYGDTLVARVADALGFVVDVTTGKHGDKQDGLEEIAEEVIPKGIDSYIDGVIMSHAVHLTGQILAADPKTDKIWAADRALDAVRHIVRRIEKEGAK